MIHQDPAAAWQRIAEADVILFHLLDPRQARERGNCKEGTAATDELPDIPPGFPFFLGERVAQVIPSLVVYIDLHL